MIENFLNKRVTLIVRGIKNERLVFTATVLEVSGGFVRIRDKFGEERVIGITDILQIAQVNGGGGRV